MDPWFLQESDVSSGECRIAESRRAITSALVRLSPKPRHMRRSALVITTVAVTAAGARAQSNVVPASPGVAVNALRTEAGVAVDGVLDEAARAAAPPVPPMRQILPRENVAESNRALPSRLRHLAAGVTYLAEQSSLGDD